MERHFDLLGLLWIIYGSAMTLLRLAFLALQLTFLGEGETTGELLLVLLAYIPGIAGGIMLRQRRRWARILLLVMAVVNMISFPLGTLSSVLGIALGFYTLFVLLRRPRRRLPRPDTEEPLT